MTARCSHSSTDVCVKWLQASRVPPLSETTRSLFERKQPSHFHTRTRVWRAVSISCCLSLRYESCQLFNCGSGQQETDTNGEKHFTYPS